MRIISSGAESTIYLNTRKSIIKDRLAKKYRIAEIDSPLRTMRTRKELKVLSSLDRLGLAVPKIISSTPTTIEMEYIDGMQLKKILDKRPQLAQSIGKSLTTMHDADIIHGDLTTSNMILKEMKDRDDPERLFFIDFGLSFFSKRIEDKAVDIHLFKQALESRHFRIADAAYSHFLKTYSPKDKEKILERLSIVEQRGKYKEKT